ncbi:MAG: trypsin-like serine protease [Bdellovibrionota bacterium]
MKHYFLFGFLFLVLSPVVHAQELRSDTPPDPEAIYYGIPISPINTPVALLQIVYSSGEIATCSGVVVKNETLLTAAHCLVDGPISAIVIYAGGYGAYGVYYGVDANYIPLGLIAAESFFDIGYVKLDRKLPRSVKPAKLASRYPAYGEWLFVYGFGRDEANGVGALRGGVMQATGTDGVVIDAIRPPGGSATCQGDSGGPAFIVKKQKPYLVGLTSYGGVSCSASTGFSSLLSPHAKSFIKLAKKKLKRR